MSPATDNFIHSLVEMSKAFEELPAAKAELAHTLESNQKLSEVIGNREESILKLKSEIERLHAQVRDTEAQRDDAELRFLEADDRTHKALDFIKTTFGSAGSVIQSLEPPPAPEPVAVPEPVPNAQPVPVEQSPYYNPPMQGQVQSEPLPPIGSQTSSNEPVQSQSEPSPTPAPAAQTGTGTESAASSSEQGQSVSDPTKETTESPKVDGPTTTSGIQTGVSSEPPVDDVGYHNEPSFDGHDWTKWDAWAERMNARYGIGMWPIRFNVVNIA